VASGEKKKESNQSSVISISEKAKAKGCSVIKVGAKSAGNSAFTDYSSLISDYYLFSGGS